MTTLHTIIIFLNQFSRQNYFKILSFRIFPKIPNIPTKFPIFLVEIYRSQNSRKFCIPIKNVFRLKDRYFNMFGMILWWALSHIIYSTQSGAKTVQWLLVDYRRPLKFKHHYTAKLPFYSISHLLGAVSTQWLDSEGVITVDSCRHQGENTVDQLWVSLRLTFNNSDYTVTVLYCVVTVCLVGYWWNRSLLYTSVLTKIQTCCFFTLM